MLSYSIFQQDFKVELVNLIIGLVIIFFVILELAPSTSKLSIDKKYLPFGGILSGFFGGLSGNQGAFRSMFLLKTSLSKESFIATNAIIASLVDISRFTVYGATFLKAEILRDFSLLAVAVVSAFLGSFLSRKLIPKITINTVRIIVVILLLIISFGLITGLI